MGVCRPVLQILTQFHTPKLTFSTPVFRPGVGRNYVIIKANSDTVRTSTWCSHKWESEIAGVYFSQTTEIYFCLGFSCCGYYRSVRYIEVSARRELTIRWLERQEKDFLKSNSNSNVTFFSYSFGIETTYTFTWFPRKPYPNSDQNRQSL